MLRVKIELVPHGIEALSEVLDTIYITNDGTGFSGGPNEGGVGNYEVHDNETLTHLHTVDYPNMYACGFIKGVERGPEHRIFLAEEAIGIVRESRKTESRVIRRFGDDEQTVSVAGMMPLQKLGDA